MKQNRVDKIETNYIITNQQYVIKNGGHINAESGYIKFKEILKVL